MMVVSLKWALSGKGIMVRSAWDVSREIRQGLLVPLLPAFTLPSADIVALTSLQEKSGFPALRALST